MLQPTAAPRPPVAPRTTALATVAGAGPCCNARESRARARARHGHLAAEYDAALAAASNKTFPMPKTIDDDKVSDVYKRLLEDASYNQIAQATRLPERKVIESA